MDPGKGLPQCLIGGLKLQDPAGHGGSCQSALQQHGLLAQKTPESLRTWTPPSQDGQCSRRCWSGLPALPTLLQALQGPPGEAHPTLTLSDRACSSSWLGTRSQGLHSSIPRGCSCWSMCVLIILGPAFPLGVVV